MCQSISLHQTNRTFSVEFFAILNGSDASVVLNIERLNWIFHVLSQLLLERCTHLTVVVKYCRCYIHAYSVYFGHRLHIFQFVISRDTNHACSEITLENSLKTLKALQCNPFLLSVNGIIEVTDNYFGLSMMKCDAKIIMHHATCIYYACIYVDTTVKIIDRKIVSLCFI